MSAVEEKIGVVTDSLNRVGVAVVRLTDGDLRLGDRVKITGRTTAPWLAREFREQAEPAAPPTEAIGRRTKKAK